MGVLFDARGWESEGIRVITEERTETRKEDTQTTSPNRFAVSTAAKKKRPKKRTPGWVRTAAMFVLAAAVVFGGVRWWQARRSAAAQQTQYRVAAVEIGSVKKTVSANGTLQPWSVVDIKSKAGGRVDELAVEVGDMVTKGQVLARIDPSDTQLTVKTAQADIEAARAREQQSVTQYQLQVQQSEVAIRNAQSQVDAAQAGLNAARARLKTAQDQATAQPGLTSAAISSAQANYDSVVQQRQQLDATQPQERATAKSAYDQAAANEKNARTSLERQKSLLQKGFVAAQVVDQAQAAYDVAKAQLNSASARLRTIDAELKADRQAADARVAQAKAQLASARAQSIDVTSRNNALAEAQAAVKQAQEQVTQAQAGLAQAQANRANNQIKSLDVKAAQATIARSAATLENAQETLSQTTVRAPSEGVVLQKYVEQGTIITSGQSLNATGTSLVQLGDTSKMYANVSVDETDIASVEEGQPVDVSVDAYPGVPFEGKVARINPQAVVENNVTTFAVRVEIDNSSPTFRLLKPGMNVTCEFVVGQAEDVVTVPSEAIHEDDEGAYVEVANGGKPAPAPAGEGRAAKNTLVGVRIERRTIETGLEGNDGIEVKSGLKAGEKIVVQTIKPTPAQSSRGAGTSPFAGGGGGRGFGGGGGGGRGR